MENCFFYFQKKYCKSFYDLWSKVGDCGKLDIEKWGETMFMGEYNHNLDTKGRIIVPSKFRDALSNEFVITRGLDKCLFIYTNDEWSRIEEKMKELPLTRKDVRKFMRMFFSGAIRVEVDKQGRVNIPQNLREYAGLTKACTVIGVSSRVEIWDTDKWNDFYDESEDNFEDIAEDLIDFNF